MRKIKILGLMLLATTLLMSCSKDDDNQLYEGENAIPKEIQLFVNKHFPNNRIVILEVNIVGETKEVFKYEVQLEGDIELEFNGKKEIVEIESKTKLPDSLFPSNLRDYVSKNYPDNFIVGMKIKKDHQEIKLNNGVEKKFKMNGDLLL